MINSFTRLFLLIIFLFVITSVNSYAQFNDYTIKLGVQVNALLSDTELDKDLRPSDADFKFSGLGRLFLIGSISTGNKGEWMDRYFSSWWRI